MSGKIHQERDIIISCLHGNGPYLARELESLGYKVLKSTPTVAITKGTYSDTLFLNLWLRTASHVYLALDTARIKTVNQLYAWIKNIFWEDWIAREGYFSVQSYVKTDVINDGRFANLKVKDAIADRFMEKFGSRPDSGPDRSKAVVNLQWVGDEATISVDTSGETLSKRGYRQIPGEAPLAESLAAAIILSTKWDKKTPFVNPMCGSGTLAIEAAMIAYGIAPGVFRYNYGFKHLKPFNPSKWRELVEATPKPVDVKTPLIPIILSDNKRKAVSQSRMNAESAGVAHLLTFEAGDFSRITLPDPPATIVLNPPYGNRLGEVDELEKLYPRMGDFFKNKCIDYTAYIFTGNLELAKQVGLKTSVKKEFFNAKLECRLLEYEVYEGSK